MSEVNRRAEILKLKQQVKFSPKVSTYQYDTENSGTIKTVKSRWNYDYYATRKCYLKTHHEFMTVFLHLPRFILCLCLHTRVLTIVGMFVTINSTR